ncbi:MAG TPA: imidazole glycerol phosphate synthase subunit HisH [Promineifilum sp.]|nr:imidazole glycerol phosphate synthase subunit HisH [Promineifilum sp.]
MIDYGGSNLRSVQKAVEAVGATVLVTDDPDRVVCAERLVLPGVGAFGAGIAALRARGLDEATRACVRRGGVLLGICLGMQLLFDESEELGLHLGLGLVPGRVVRFRQPAANGAGEAILKVPHVGWNQIAHDGRHPLLAGVSSGAHAYFVHSYLCAPANPVAVVATADYGGPFAAIVGRGRVFGIQFHPEKSQSVGLRILRNFAAIEDGWDGI